MKKNYLWIVIFSILVAIPVITNIVVIYTDWLWFLNVGYRQVFVKILVTRLELGAALGCAFFAFMMVNLAVADRLSRVGFIKIGPDAIELPGIETLGKHIRTLMIAASAFLSVLIGIEASSRWDMLLQFQNPTSFGRTDPVFGRDISYFVFQLPFINYMYQWLTVALFFGIVLSVAVYAYKRGLIITNRGVHFKPTLYSHLSILIALFFIIKAFGYRLYALNMLVSSRGFVAGAGYTDLHLRMPLMNVLMAAALVGAAIMIANVFVRGWKLPLAAAALLILFSAGGAAYPEIVQKLRVNPNEISMEKPFIKRQIDYTREAYDINRISIKPHEARLDLNADQIRSNSLTIENIRLWDSRPLLQTYRQLQEIRTYYGFNSVDVDRYPVEGKLRQVMLSARELSYDKLPARTWINERLSFTHGYGLCMSPVNRFTPEGLPEFFIKDIPPAHGKDFDIRRPQIYYGEMMNDYVFVNTRAEEFDYPLGEENRMSRYDAQGGIPLDSFIKKAAFAIRFSSLAAILNTDITRDSRVMIYRNILGGPQQSGRASKIFPLIQYDSDPYIVIDNGRLKWVLDGYTTSNNYPYSAKLSQGAAGFNYIRNSVKTVIDAYDGKVTFYLFDEKDPIISAYNKIFPGLFTPKEEMPESLRAHIRYPVDMFKVQAKVLMAYHMTDPNVFYNKEDLWETGREVFYQNEQEVEPYYTIMKLPDGDKEEYVLMLPFTPSKRANMAAWMCARNDGDKYGQLLVYTFPKKKLIFGPMQIEARIDQDSEISKQFTLWSQGGSQIIRGNTLVIPVEESFLYVEPVYLKAEKGDIPELKRVIASIGNRVAMGESIESALEQLVGAPTASKNTGNRDSLNQPVLDATVIQQIRTGLEHLSKAKERLRELDWKGFGEEFDAAESALKNIRQPADVPKTPSAN
ncbi:MAG: UPF0182 family protein [bacterium]